MLHDKTWFLTLTPCWKNGSRAFVNNAATSALILTTSTTQSVPLQRNWDNSEKINEVIAVTSIKIPLCSAVHDTTRSLAIGFWPKKICAEQPVLSWRTRRSVSKTVFVKYFTYHAHPHCMLSLFICSWRVRPQHKTLNSYKRSPWFLMRHVETSSTRDASSRHNTTEQVVPCCVESSGNWVSE